MHNLAVTVQNWIGKFWNLMELLLVNFWSWKLHNFQHCLIYVILPVTLRHSDVSVSKHYCRFHLSRLLGANVMPTDDAKFRLFCCLAVNERRSRIVTFTALLSSIMKCFALGMILNGTWRVHCGHCFSLITTFVRNKYVILVVNFCLNLWNYLTEIISHQVSVLWIQQWNLWSSVPQI